MINHKLKKSMVTLIFLSNVHEMAKILVGGK
jgi:hypothetical protein